MNETLKVSRIFYLFCFYLLYFFSIFRSNGSVNFASKNEINGPKQNALNSVPIPTIPPARKQISAHKASVEILCQKYEIDGLRIAIISDILSVSYTHLDVYKRQQIRLWTACPSLMLRNCSIRQSACIIFIKTWRRQIIITVLIMDSKHITTLMHGIGKLFHSVPTTGFFRCV